MYLKCENIKKKFNDNVVLNGCNLEVSEGEIIYIKGANGSGKSTLLRILSSLLIADEGEIIKSENTYIGALIENPEFGEYSTLKDNLIFLASLRNKVVDINSIRNLCESFNLDFNDKRLIKYYSLGMKQKVGIIQAIMENQNVILLDEPTRGLDEYSLQVFIQTIMNLKNKGCSIIIASHEYIEGINFSHHYVLKDGSLSMF